MSSRPFIIVLIMAGSIIIMSHLQFGTVVHSTFFFFTVVLMYVENECYALYLFKKIAIARLTTCIYNYIIMKIKLSFIHVRQIDVLH